MTSHESSHTPTEINLHRKSRVLSITFDDGRRFELPCEYLRVFARAAEEQTGSTPVTGKEDVNIERIEPQGTYAVRLIFDDGHDTSIYSWETLYELGDRQEENWQQYLARLAELGLTRHSEGPGPGTEPRRIRLLYFAYLAQKLHKESEEIELPSEVTVVKDLLPLLRRRERSRGYLLADDAVRVTVNKQFAEPFTRLDTGDEVGIVPLSPNPPVQPNG
ncbi:MAG: gamma-butyrobetaine hydroxylase-like domain-containing protein [Pseudomonadota bacterium]